MSKKTKTYVKLTAFLFVMVTVLISLKFIGQAEESETGSDADMGFVAQDGNTFWYEQEGTLFRQTPFLKRQVEVAETGYAIHLTPFQEYVYYENVTDGGKMYRVKKRGGEPEVLTDSWSSYLFVTEGDLYYVDMETGRLMRFVEDGEDQTVIHGDHVFQPVSDGQHIVYVSGKDGVLKKHSLLSGKTDNLTDFPAWRPTVKGDWIYFLRPVDDTPLLGVGGLWKVPLAGGTAEPVLQETMVSFALTEQGIVFSRSSETYGFVSDHDLGLYLFNGGEANRISGDWYINLTEVRGKVFMQNEFDRLIHIFDPTTKQISQVN
ncbi:hypothetical protein GCM10010965_27690 [Caldalkalibacillus thermarum]|uniref:DUF5050 domain-containing protein n=1 Tax=Caldalkalibacillus thermarum TaxID=296745 RepID=UPI0016647282|nr:DUF5050 domain-containing protein [Caldalkalibacillus thermarum]GGK33311.1 hypothetical protein GCM10010965_27690 [Caldalkalibacillus thermarum]